VIKEIGIRNFVLIDTLRLEWERGLNVLTGETGAGKSIVLDAIGLLLGDRFKSDSVRQGAERSEIDGIFEAPKTPAFRRWSNDLGFDASDELVIRREGYADGRSRAFLNDRPVTLSALQTLRGFLVDVHGQNEHQQILKPAVQRELLDRFAGLEASVEALEPLYRRWRAIDDERNAETLSEQERLKKSISSPSSFARSPKRSRSPAKWSRSRNGCRSCATPKNCAATRRRPTERFMKTRARPSSARARRCAPSTC